MESLDMIAMESVDMIYDIGQVSNAQAKMIVGRLLLAGLESSAHDDMRAAWTMANTEHNYDLSGIPSDIMKAFLTPPARLAPKHAEKIASFVYLNGFDPDYFGYCLKVKSLSIHDFYLQLWSEFMINPSSRHAHTSFHQNFGVYMTLSQQSPRLARLHADKENFTPEECGSVSALCFSS